MTITKTQELEAILLERDDLCDRLDAMSEAEWRAQSDRVHDAIDRLDEKYQIVDAFMERA